MILNCRLTMENVAGHVQRKIVAITNLKIVVPEEQQMNLRESEMNLRIVNIIYHILT